MIQLKQFIISVLLSGLALTTHGQSGIDADFELISDNSNLVIEKSGVTVLQTDQIFQANNEKGRTALSLREIVYQPNISRVKVIKAETIVGNRVFPVDLKTIEVRAISNSNVGLENLKKIIIPFNQVKVGSKIRLNYEFTKFKPLIPGVGEFVFAYGLQFPESNSRVTIRSEKKIVFTLLDRFKFLKIKRQKLANEYIMTVETARRVNSLKLIEKLDVVPVGHVPRLYISTAKSWAHHVNTIEPQYEKAISGPLPQAFKSIINGARHFKDPIQQLDFVLAEISKVFGYSGNWINQDRMMFPRGHVSVVQSGKGDCKDFATSVVAIARQLGLKAHVALVNSSRIEDRSLRDIPLYDVDPNLSLFNHAIAYIELGSGQKLWVDGTTAIPVSNIVWTNLLDSPALVLKKGTTSLTKIDSPDSRFEYTKLVREARVINDTHATWSGTFQARGLGAATVGIAYEKLPENDFNNFISSRTLGAYLAKESGASVKMSNVLPPSGVVNMSFSALGKSPVVKADDGKPSIALALPRQIEGYFGSSEESGAVAPNLGINTIVTRLKGVKAVEGFLAQCHVYSEWVDFIRNVRIEGDDTIVTDVITNKSIYVNPAAMKSKEFKHFTSDVVGCLQNSKLALDPPNLKGMSTSRLALRAIPISASAKKEMANLFLFGKLNPRDYTYKAQKAIAIMNLVLEQNPNDHQAQLIRLKAILRTGYHSGTSYSLGLLMHVWSELDKLISKAPNLARAYRTRSEIFISLGNHQKALSDLGLAHKLEPSNPLIMSEIAEVYAYLKQGQLANQWLKSSRDWSTQPHHWLFYYGSAVTVADELNDKVASLKAREKLVELNPDNPWSLHNLSLSYRDFERWDDSIRASKKAIQLMNFGVGRNTLAHSLADKAISLKSSRSFLEISNNKEIEGLLKEAIKYDKSIEKSYYHLANIYSARAITDNDPNHFEQSSYYILAGLQNCEYKKRLQDLQQSLQYQKKSFLANSPSESERTKTRHPASNGLPEKKTRDF